MKPYPSLLLLFLGLATASIITSRPLPPLEDLPLKDPFGDRPQDKTSVSGAAIFAGVSRQGTIYDIIKSCPHTQRFAALLDGHPGLRDRLSGLRRNHTLFVPTDEAWDRVPRGELEGGRLDRLLSYHVLGGGLDAGQLSQTRTLATLLAEDELRGHPQRLRLGASIFGAHVNFYSKLIATDVHASNGVIHALSSVLLPPPRQSELISLLPDKLGTLSLALAKTGLLDALERHKGRTLFAPTDFAWLKLGRPATAFLFSERGETYLRALLKYHVAANRTLYSDHFYGNDLGEDDLFSYKPSQPQRKGGVFPWSRSSEPEPSSHTKHHVRLPTLLEDQSLFVEISTSGSTAAIVVNGEARVTVKDGIARDGVVQVLGSVLLPPRPKSPRGSDEDGEARMENLSEEELIERLRPYVDEHVQPWDDL